MKKWTIGDKVKVDDRFSFFHGMQGVVVSFNEDLQYNVFVLFTSGDKCNFRHKELIGDDQ